MNNQITINKENILNAYQQATEEQKELLENMFGEDIFKPKDIRDRIKTFNDAVEILGKDNQSVIDFHVVYNYILNSAIANKYCSRDILAYTKLRVIVDALNEGWKPTFDDGEHRYYPMIYIYTKEDYEELSENKKKELIVVGNSKIKLNENCGDIYALEAGTLSYSVFNNGYHLALRTWELAEYCGKQFIDIWYDFLFA